MSGDSIPSEPDLQKILLILLTFGFLLILNAITSASETALRSLRKSRLLHLAEEGDRRANRVLQLLESPRRFLPAIEVAATLFRITLGIVAYLLGSYLFQHFYINPLFVGLTALVVLVILLTFAEILPKSLAVRRAETVALWVAPWVHLLTLIGYPLIRLADGFSHLLLKSLGQEGEEIEVSPFVTEEEVKMLAEEGVRTGELEEEEKEMIHSVIELADTVVREVMVPRVDIVAVEVNADPQEVLDAILQKGHSRIPVYEGTIDNIIGVVHARDVLASLAQSGIPSFSLRDLPLRTPYLIPENKKVSDLLKELRAKKTAIAIVVDEYGGTAGLVTLEDLVEEIVGEITDEWESEEIPSQRVDENTIIYDARVPIEDVNEEMKLSLPEEEFDTIGGLVFGLLGRLPERGETVECNGALLTVEQTNGRRIRSVRVRKKLQEEGPPEDKDS